MTFDEYVKRDKEQQKTNQVSRPSSLSELVEREKALGAYYQAQQTDPLMEAAMAVTGGSTTPHYGGHDIVRDIASQRASEAEAQKSEQSKKAEGVKKVTDYIGKALDFASSLPGPGHALMTDAVGGKSVVRKYVDSALSSVGEAAKPKTELKDYAPVTAAYQERQAAEQKQRQDEIKRQIAAMDEKRSQARIDAGEITDPAARKAALAEADALDQQYAGMMDKLHAAGGKYGVGDFVGDALNAFQAASATPLSTLDKLDYWASVNLGLIDPKDEQERERAHAYEQYIAEEEARAKQGRNGIGRTAIGAFEAAGNVLGSTAFAYATGIPQAATQFLGPVAANLAATETNLGASAGEKALNTARRWAGNAMGDLIASPTNLAISAQSGINTYDRARMSGASDFDAFAAGLAGAAAEYFSNKMFSGTPLIDSPEEKGYVVELIEQAAKATGHADIFQKVFGNGFVNFVFDKSGEGLEEVVTGVLDPLIEKLTYNPDADLATAKELIDDYIGGVAMSLLLGVGEPVTQFQAQKAEARQNRALLYMIEAAMQGRGYESAARANEKDLRGVDEEVTRAVYDFGAELAKQESVPARQPMTGAEMVQTFAEDLDMGPVGVEAARSIYQLTHRAEDTAGAADWFAGFRAMYEAGRKGESMESVTVPAAQNLTDDVRERAYNAGQADGTADVHQETQPAQKYQYQVEDNADGTATLSVTDADGAEQFRSQFPDRAAAAAVADQFRQMEGVTTNAEDGNEDKTGNAGVSAGQGGGRFRARARKVSEGRAARQRDAESIRAAANAEGIQKVSAKERGIAYGTDSKTMQILPERIWTAGMRSVQKENAAKGVRTVFFNGEIEFMRGGKARKARGEISEDGRTMYICADDADFTPEQIAKHEDFHRRSRNDAKLREAARKKLLEDHSEEELQEIMNAYINAYGWGSMTNEQIMEEILADAYAGIDILSYSMYYEGATRFTDAVQQVVAEREGEQQKTRGPPTEAQKSEKLDADYMAAVERRDMDTAQRMVDEAAKAAGYTEIGYHGTRAFGFTKIDTQYSDDGISFFLSDLDTAQTYSGVDDVRSVNAAPTTSWKSVVERCKKTANGFINLLSETQYPDVKEEKEEIQGIWDAISTTDFSDEESVGDLYTEASDFVHNFWISFAYYLQKGETNQYKEFPDAYSLAYWLEDSNNAEYAELRKSLDELEISFEEAILFQEQQDQRSGNYRFYFNPDGLLKINANGANWNKIKSNKLPMKKTWDTREIAKYAKENGYSGVYFKDLVDDGGQGEIRVSNPADVYILFDPQRQAKSADPVTYDDSGNVIPLSERFNPENEDIRFSEKLPAEAELRRQNENLQKKVAYWRGQTKRTKAPTARIEDARRVARDMVKAYRSQGDVSTIADAIKAAADFVLDDKQFFANGADAYAALKEKVYPAAREIVDNAEALREGDDVAMYDEVRGVLQMPMKIAVEDAHDIAPDGWGAYRNSIRGRVNVSINGKGTPVDVVYHQLSERFPSLFPEDITHPSAQLEQMVSVIDELTPVYENPFSYDMAEAIEFCANDIIDRIMGEDVRETPPTFADRAAEKLAEEKAKGEAKAAKVRAEKNAQIDEIRQQNAARTAERLAKVRADRDEKIKALKQHYADVREAARERKADSAARTKLLKIIRRLSKKKMSVANRALLNEYIGDIDTFAKSLTGGSIRNLEALRDWYDEQKRTNENFIRNEALEEKISRLSKLQINDLTADKVRELTEVLLEIDARMRANERFVKSKLAIEFYHAGNQVMWDLANAQKGKILRELRPLTAFRRIVGWNEDSPLVIAAKEMIEGERQADLYKREALRPFSQLLADKQFLKDSYGKDAKSVKVSGVDKDGKPVTVEITPMMRVALYLHSLNDENFRHIYEGGVVAPNMEIYRKGKLAEAYNVKNTVRLTRPALAKLAESMTEKERQFAKLLHWYYNEYAPKYLNAVSLELDGWEKFTTPDYYHITVDPDFLSADYEAMLAAGDPSLARPGWSQERKASKKPIILRDANMEFLDALTQNAAYAHQAIPLHNMNRLMNVKLTGDRGSVIEEMGEAYPDRSAENYVRDFLRDYGGHKRAAAKGIGKAIEFIRSGYSGGVLVLSAGTALKQFSSYPAAAAVIDPLSLVKAMNPAYKANVNFIDKRTAAYTKRTEGMSMLEIAELREQGKHIPKALNWIQGMDMATTSLLKRAAYFDVLKSQPELQPGTEAFEKAVTDLYIQAIEETQPNYSTALRPDILRSKDAMERSLIMFATQPLQNFNVLYEAVGQYGAAVRADNTMNTEETAKAKKAAGKKLGRAVGSQIASSLLYSLIQYGWDKFRGKDDKYKPRKDEDISDFLAFMRGIGINMLNNGAGMVPLMKPVLEFVEACVDKVAKATGHNEVFGQNWYGIEVATVGALNDAAQSMYNMIGAVAKAANSGDSKDAMDAVKKSINAAEDIAVMFGIPASNVHALVKSIARVIGMDEKYLI